jgi:hypothetical protein
MAAALSVDEVLELRMRSQQLAGDRAGDPIEVVRRLGALQAQSTRAARLAVRPRSESLVAGDIDRATNETRSLVRTWAMRGTLHMLPAEDVRWIVDMFRPPAEAVNRRQLELGLDAALLRRAMPVLREILSGLRALTRGELVADLVKNGVAISAKGQAPAHLVAFAARQGIVCRGSDRSDDEPTYVLLDEWIGPQEPIEPKEALSRLARRYFSAHGPATAKDFAYWSGLPVGTARRACALVAHGFVEVDAAGEPALLHDQVRYAGHLPGVPHVRLLGQFDEYLLGYRDRDIALERRFARRIQAGGGMIAPALAVDGRIVGTWRQRRSRAGTVVLVEPFEPLDETVRPGLDAEIADLGRYQGLTTTLELAT